MVSPCPPSTRAWTSRTDAPTSWATKVRKRAVSRMPAIPITRLRGKPLTARATWAMASSGLLTTITTAAAETAVACLTTPATIPALVISRSSRDIPVLRAMPPVTTITSLPAVSSYPLVPVTMLSKPITGPACRMSRAFPWGSPGTMSTRTISA